MAIIMIKWLIRIIWFLRRNGWKKMLSSNISLMGDFV